MSGNRSVQAAQRRRAGGPEPAAPGRGPQPSINSSQMFASQGQPQPQSQPRSGQVPSGRLAGQHAQLQQQQMQQQQMSDSQQASGIAGINKMTFAQAVTLITLRLGKVETQLFQMSNDGMSNSHNGMFNSEMEEGNENMVMIDKSTIDSIMTRLESLEKRAPSTGTSSAEMTLLKQQFDAIKPVIAQNTKTTTTLTKDQKEVKVQYDILKSELTETRELLTALQTMSMDNSQKIFEMMSGEFTAIEETIEVDDCTVIDCCDAECEGECDNELIGTDLKGLIEQELNA